MDSGATCNVLPAAYLNKNDLTKYIKHTSQKLKLYDGSLMRTLGSCSLCCEQNGRKFMVDFVVVKENVAPIIGLETCLKE